VGGIEELTGKLAAELNVRDIAVSILTHRWPRSLSPSEAVDGIHVRRFEFVAPRLRPRNLALYPWRRSELFRQLDAEAKTDPPAVIHAIGASWQAHHLASWGRARNIPFVLTLQGETAMDDGAAYQSGLKSLLIRRALRRTVASAVVVTSCSAWTRSRAAMIAPKAASTIVIPNGVRVAEFADTGPVPSDGPVLAYGRLVHNKGFDLLIRAWRRSDRELWIGGDGPMAGSLRDAGPDVRFLGRLNRADVVNALRLASLVVVPSRLEPFGIVALEAMAAGRPVVASSIGGAKDFVSGGIIVDPHDQNALRLAIDTALARPELGEVGRERAAAFDWAGIAGQYVAIYERYT